MKQYRIVTVLISALVLASWGAASASADLHKRARTIKTGNPIIVVPHIDIDTRTVVALVDTRTVLVHVDTATVLPCFDTSTVIGHESQESQESQETGEKSDDNKGDDDSNSVATLPALGTKSLPAPTPTLGQPPRKQEVDKKSTEKHKG